MMQRMLAVLEMTIRRLMRSRLLWVAVVGSLLVIGMFMSAVVSMVRTLSAGQAVPGAETMHVVGTIIPVLGALAQLIAIFVGISVVKRDVVDGTVASVLSKPVTRGEYIAASYAGSALYLLLMWALFALVLTVFAAAFKAGLSGPAYAAILGRYLVCVMTMGIALCFSIRFHPWVAVLLTALVLRGRATIDGLAYLLAATGVKVPGVLVEALEFPFPIGGALDALGERLTRGTLAEQNLAPAFVHVIDYGLVMALCAYLLFRRLEINRVRE